MPLPEAAAQNEVRDSDRTWSLIVLCTGTDASDYLVDDSDADIGWEWLILAQILLDIPDMTLPVELYSPGVCIDI
jgi:hypothetical protein